MPINDLPPVILDPDDFDLEIVNGRARSIQLKDRAMAKLTAAGYLRTMPVNITVDVAEPDGIVVAVTVNPR